MEDAVIDIETPVFPSNNSSVESSKEDQIQENDERAKEGISSGVIINHIISNMVSGTEGVDEEHEELQVKGGKKEGGILKSLISSLVTVSPPLIPEPQGAEENSNPRKSVVSEAKLVDNDGGAEDNDSNGGGGRAGGVFNNLISDMFKASEGRDEEVKGDENEENGQGSGRTYTNTENKRSNGGGIIDNLVSHLPTALADDIALETDEASILIHSIVHD